MITIALALVSQFICLWTFMVADQPDKRREALGILQRKKPTFLSLLSTVLNSKRFHFV